MELSSEQAPEPEIAVQEILLTREELYDAVWDVPLLVLAKRWGISDVAIGKACRRLKIPLPGRGYWAKANAGVRQARTKLPEPLPGVPERISFHGRRVAHGRPYAPRPPRELPPSILDIAGSEAQSKPHPFVLETRRMSRGAERSREFVDLPDAPVDLWVSRRSLERALDLLNALFVVLEAQGMKVICEYEGRQRQTLVLVEGVKLKIRMRERSRRIDKPASTRDRWASRYDYAPSGILRFEIGDWSYRSSTTWEDRQYLKLEHHLREVPDALKACATEENRREAERAAEEARWREEARLRQERELELQIERKKQRDLLRQARNAERARLIRELCARAPASGGVAAQEWVDWALTQADALDPLMGQPRPWDVAL